MLSWRPFYMKKPKRRRHKLLGTLGGRMIQLLLRMIMLTCRLEFIDHAGFHELSKKGRFILFMWHNRLSLVETFLRRFAAPNAYTAVISTGRSGDLIEGMAKSYKQTKVIRMPAQNRHVALKKIITSLDHNEVIMLAADGDMGPRYQVKPGIAFTSQTASAPVVPFSFSASRFWQLKTWDRMIIPKPFSTITIGIGAPISITDDESKEKTKEPTNTLLDLDRKTYEAIDAKNKSWPI